MRVCYLTCGLHILGTYNAVLAWLVKKAEDNQVELPFIFRVGVLVFQFSRERRRENLMMVTLCYSCRTMMMNKIHIHPLHTCTCTCTCNANFAGHTSATVGT